MSRSLGRASAMVGVLTLLSRLLGFARDMVVAQAFGVGGATDAFFVAFKIPNFLRRLFAEGAFAQALVPVLADYRQRSPESLRDFLAPMGAVLMVLALGFTGLAWLAAPWLVQAVAPGFSANPAQFDLAVQLLRITLPYVPFILLAAHGAAVLNAYDQFTVPAMTPMLLSLTMMAAAWGVAPSWQTPIVNLAWAVSLGGAAQCLLQLPWMIRLGLWTPWRWNWRHAGVQRVLSLMGPALFGASVTQINLFLNTILASLLPTGSVSWLYYADRLLEFPVGLIGIALGTAVLPSLARSHTAQDPQAFSAALDWALRWMWLIAWPASLGLMWLAEPIMLALFSGGEFSVHDSAQAALALTAYAAGLVGFVAVRVLAPGYSASQDNAHLLRGALWAVFINLGLSALLSTWLAHAGLALATALAALFNAAWLLHGLCRRGRYQAQRGWMALFSRSLLAGVAMSVALYFSHVWLAHYSGMRWAYLGALLAVILGAALLYGALLWLAGLRPTQLRAPH